MIGRYPEYQFWKSFKIFVPLPKYCHQRVSNIQIGRLWSRRPNLSIYATWAMSVWQNMWLPSAYLGHQPPLCFVWGCQIWFLLYVALLWCSTWEKYTICGGLGNCICSLKNWRAVPVYFGVTMTQTWMSNCTLQWTKMSRSVLMRKICP